MYENLVKELRYCVDGGEECAGCKRYGQMGCDVYLMEEAADAIEKLQAYADLYRDGGETAMRMVEQYKTAYITEHNARIEETKQNCPHYIRNVHDRGDDSLCDKYKCEVNALPKWIPVTERLPLYEVLGDMYLCYHVSGRNGQLSWIQIDWWNGEKFRFKKVGNHDHVTHWMPLPEPPKEETE